MIWKKSLLKNTWTSFFMVKWTSVWTKFFGNLLLAPGPRHIEKHFLLTVSKFAKNIFMRKVGDKLGKRNYYKLWRPSLVLANCSDSIWSVYQGTDTCLYRILRWWRCFSHLMSWRNERIINPNFNFYYDHIFTIMLGLKSCCAGTQRRNSENHLTH